MISMKALLDIFCIIAQEEFAFLVSDFGFTANASVDVHWSQVDFDSERVTIRTWWDYRDGTDVGIIARADTIWIRPASPHGCNLSQLLRMFAPTAMNEFPKVSSRGKTEENLRPILAFYAKQLRICGEPIMKGDLSLCEDVLITNYCQTTKSIPRNEYHKVFREECAGLPAHDQECLEAAIASGSYLQIWFLVQEFAQSRKVHTARFLTASNDFWLQYCR